MEKRPWVSAAADVTTPVAMFFASIVVPGSEPPLLSFTVPWMVALTACAAATLLPPGRRKSAASAHSSVRVRMCTFRIVSMVSCKRRGWQPAPGERILAATVRPFNLNLMFAIIARSV